MPEGALVQTTCLCSRGRKYNETGDFLPQLFPVTTTRVVLVPDAAELAVLLATGRIEPEDFSHGPTWDDSLADVGSYWTELFEPYRTSADLAWRKGIPGAYWLEDVPHGQMRDADYFLAAIRTVVIDGLGPRRPQVHEADEAQACRDLCIGALPMLTRLSDARRATVALEADMSLDYGTFRAPRGLRARGRTRHRVSRILRNCGA